MYVSVRVHARAARGALAGPAEVRGLVRVLCRKTADGRSGHAMRREVRGLSEETQREETKETETRGVWRVNMGLRTQKLELMLS